MPVLYTDTNSSSAIERIGYDVITTELRIVFRDKEEYPEYIWGNAEVKLKEAFLLAPSKGKFYHQFIKGNPKYTLNRASRFGWRLQALGRGTKKRIKRAVMAAEAPSFNPFR
jgi:hypothetical protein